jgi:hypothetical protein
MPRNTIQIRLTRIRISLHSAGCSSTKRVTIWNTPSADAMTSISRRASSAGGPAFDTENFLSSALAFKTKKARPDSPGGHRR